MLLYNAFFDNNRSHCPMVSIFNSTTYYKGFVATNCEKIMEKAFSNCDFGCVHAKKAKAFAPVAVVLVQLTTPAALSVFWLFR